MTNTVEIKTHTELQRLIKKGADVYIAVAGMPHVTIKAVKSDVLDQSKRRQSATMSVAGEDKLTDYDGVEKSLWHHVDHGKNGAIYIDGAF